MLTLLWLGVTALLIRRNSLWTPVAAAALTVAAAALLNRRRRTAPAAGPVAPGIVSPPLETPPWQSMAYLACAGALIQSALLSEGTRRPIAAGVFIAGAVAIVLTRSSPEGLARRHRRASVALAVVLAIFGLFRWSERRWATPDNEYSAAVQAAVPDRRADDVSFRGVILFVEKPAERIAPPSPLTLKSGFADPSREPLVIPFSGVYWFMRAPARVPPVTSLIQHGSPDNLFYRSADRRPLVMEAHQHLGRQISLACCRAIEVDILNVDNYPDSVFVEALAVDTSGGYPKRSLGIATVASTEFKLSGERSPKVETLPYQIQSSLLGSFDEITVRFHLSDTRNTRSARMSIQRFTLRPRGA